jgi:hypothetical protein
MNNLVAKTSVQLVAADALEHGLRNVLIGEPHQMLSSIEFSGSAEYKSSFTEVGERKSFSNAGTESTMLLEMIVGMFDYYRRNKESVALEGTEFSPEWISNIALPDFTIKAAFVGYTDPSHAESILTHARVNEHDWINDWLLNEGGDNTKILTWIKEQSIKCRQLKHDAESHGYPFFDISTQSFENYKSSVLEYFLQS